MKRTITWLTVLIINIVSMPTLSSAAHHPRVVAVPLNGCVVTGKVPAGVNPKNAVVYLEGVPFTGRPAPMHKEMDQKNLRFIPHVLAITVGSQVTFLNSDTVNHNVFGVGADMFDLGTWPPGRKRTKTFSRPGEVAILCNVHPEMSAYILVLKHPYFAQPDALGRYKIAGVPPGTYTLVIYQPERKPIKKKIQVGC